MKNFYDVLNLYISENKPNSGDGESVLTLLEMDSVIYPVCKLCRNREKAGFIEGIKVGIHLASEIT